MNYAPNAPDLKLIWEGLSPQARRTRLERAQRRLKAVQDLEARSPDESERAAAARVAPWAERTAIRKWRTKYEMHGLDGLIDLRLGKPVTMPDHIREVIVTLRRSDPDYPVSNIVSHLSEHHDFQTSEATVKRVLRRAGLARRRGPPSGRRSESTGERRVQLGGMKLLEAASIEIGYTKSLANGIKEHIKDLPRLEEAVDPDRSDRDEFGQFLPKYNQRYKKGEEDRIGPGFASIEEKRNGLDPERLQVGRSHIDVLERKLLALLAEPVLGNGRLADLRSSQGALLGEICGYPYMPATLDKMTRELKYAGVAQTLWEIHARKWLSLTESWEEEKTLAVLYVDGTSKPIWTRYFSESARVSSVGRTMPALEHVAFHTGSGVPLWMLTFSGHAPLVKVVPAGLMELEERVGSSAVGRILVIDAEGNSVPFLKQLESGEHKRGWVTRLRENILKGKRIFNRTNYRAYRETDRIRVGLTELNDPDGGHFRIRVVEMEKGSSGEVVYIGASTLLSEKEWSGEQLAELYFQRWPAQEGNFRAVNQAVGLKQVHGYGKKLVSNISVVTELDELSVKRERAAQRLSRQEEEARKCKENLTKANRALKGQRWSQQALERRTKVYLESEQKSEREGQKLLRKQQELNKKLPVLEAKSSDQEAQLTAAQEKANRTRTRIATYDERTEKIQDRREIFAHDVELDSIFTLLKVGLVLLVTYVLREYLGDAKLEVTTFLERIVTLPARVRKLPELEIVTFYYNERDPKLMKVLADNVDRINARGLRTRTGRLLRIKVDPAPPSARPPPN